LSRFTKLTPELSVQYWLEFWGPHAGRVVEGARAAGFEAHYEPRDPKRVMPDGTPMEETGRVYLIGEYVETLADKTIVFKRGLIDSILRFISVTEDCAKLQLKREANARAVCFRPSDENPVLTGFGQQRPGGGKPYHQDYSATYVDRKPGTRFIDRDKVEQVWRGFDPLYVRVKPVASEDYSLEVIVRHLPDDDGMYGIYVSAVKRQFEVPEPLKAYVFKDNSKSKERPTGSPLDGVVRENRNSRRR